MKLLTLRSGAELHPAVLMGDDVLDLARVGAALPDVPVLPATMRELLAGGSATLATLAALVDRARAGDSADSLRRAGALIRLADAVLAPVVPDGELVLSGSMNSRGHLEEMSDELPEHPCAFHKVRSALAASGDAIQAPPGHGDMLDWEGEFCLVVGMRCHRATVDEAERCIAGYTIMNDVSAREFVPAFVTAVGAAPTAQAWERNVLGKNFPGFAPIGPVIATKDEFSAPLTYHMETLVNGAVMQSSTQEDLVFGPAQMLAYFSEFYIFQPGDIISMGSPPGVGMARKPQLFLKAGDLVEVRVAQIGTLQNRIAAASDGEER